MKCIIDKQVILSQVPEGPLAAHIGAYMRSLREQGYAVRSIHRYVFLAACFSRWLKQKGVRLRSVTSDHAARYLRYRAQHVRLGRSDAGALNNLLQYLQRNGIINAKKLPARRLTPVKCCARSYEQYLREARGLDKATIRNYIQFIRSFLEERFGNGPVVLSRLRAEHCDPGSSIVFSAC